MDEKLFAVWEKQVRETAVTFEYPPTPDVIGVVWQRVAAPPQRRVVQRRLAWAAALVLLIVGGLLAVPPVRAAVWHFIRAGAISIFVDEAAEVPVTAVSPSQTIQPASAYLFELAEPITLAEAQAAVRTPLRLPSYPADLGQPDQIYRQEGDWPEAIIMVWLEPGQPDTVRLSLYHIEADNYAYKGAEQIEMTTVNGRDAIWLEAPHYFRLDNGRHEPWVFVEGRVLIWWTDEGVTYRLESGLPLVEARRIAESLK